MKKTITWLHISDIHFAARSAWRDSIARAELLSMLKASVGSKLPRPDFVFCTGDIAYGELSTQPMASQYKEARDFFAAVLVAVGPEGYPLPMERLFVVPGNHDVNRKVVNIDAQRHISAMAKDAKQHIEQINERVALRTPEYLESTKRLESYSRFFKKQCPHVDSRDAHYVFKTVVGSIPIQIVGLNSAWSCSGDEEERRVWVGAQAQLAGAKRDPGLSVALIHHPLEWLTKPDSSILEKRLGSDFHFLLHGHEHEYRSQEFHGFSVIGAGAVSAKTANEHGVMLVSLDFDSGTQQRHAFSYDADDAKWRPSTLCNDLPEPLPPGLLNSILMKSQPPEETALKDFHLSYAQSFGRPGRYTADGEYEDVVAPDSGSLNRDAEYFRHLWHDSFGPHCVEHFAGDPVQLHFQAGDASRLVEKDNLDAYFLRNCVVKQKISATANIDSKDKEDLEVSFGQFVKYVADAPVPKYIRPDAKVAGENRVTYLIGAAGIGKTLLVLKLFDFLRNTEPDHKGYRVVPIYVDLHTEKLWRSHSPEEAIRQTIQSLGRMLLERLPQAVREKLTVGFEAFEGDHAPEAAMKKLTLEMINNKYLPLFAFDNGDRFFFENARYRLFDEYSRKKHWHLDDTLIALVDKFVAESALGKIGACVLVVCRKYVYNYCKRISDGADPQGPVRQDHKVFQIYPLEPNQIVESRLTLMEAAIAAVNGKHRASPLFHARLEILRKRLESFEKTPATNLLGTIWGLAHQGHRSFLSFLAALPVDFGREAQIAERLFESPHILLRLYISNMHKRFTEEQGHFPNLYLNDSLVDLQPEYSNAHRPHVHSYWLRYLILRYALASPKFRIQSEDTIRHFTDVLHFEEDLVRLCLGSLSDPSSSMCLEILERDRVKRNSEVLQLSKRGEILVDPARIYGPLCFNFDYLQLVTDDYLLAMPKVVKNKIFVGADLGYSLKHGQAYRQGALKTLNLKVPAVLYFLRTLELSFEHEMSYRKITDTDALSALAPSFPEIRESLFRSLDAIISHFHDDGQVASGLDYRTIWAEIKAFRPLEHEIRTYYVQPTFVTA